MVLTAPMELFLLLTEIFQSFLPNFSLVRLSCQISRKFAPCMPPSASSCPSNDIFLFLFVIYIPFLEKTGHLDAPGWIPGVVALSTPPLHATGHVYDVHYKNNYVSVFGV